MVRVNQSHTTSEKFPYTTKQLAVYMKHICDNLEKEYQVEIIEEVPNFGPVEQEY